MQYWIFILVVFIAVVAIGLIASSIAASQRLLRQTDALLAQTRRADAQVHAACMIRDGALQSPGVATVADGKLILHEVAGQGREIPLADVTLVREGPGYGKIGWLGKRVFHLEAPDSKNLALGVKDPEPWRKVFGTAA